VNAAFTSRSAPFTASSDDDPTLLVWTPSPTASERIGTAAGARSSGERCPRKSPKDRKHEYDTRVHHGGMPVRQVPSGSSRTSRAVTRSCRLRVRIGELKVERDVEFHLKSKPAYPGYELLDVSWSPRNGGPYPSFKRHAQRRRRSAGGVAWKSTEPQAAVRRQSARPSMLPWGTYRAGQAVELLAELKRILSAPKLTSAAGSRCEKACERPFARRSHPWCRILRDGPNRPGTRRGIARKARGVATMSSRKVLLVDDEPGADGRPRAVYARRGLRRSTRRRRSVAVETFKRELPGVVVLDLNLPGFRGREVLRRIREICDVPIIMLTARVAEVDRVVRPRARCGRLCRQTVQPARGRRPR